jgi:hypothetical protein
MNHLIEFNCKCGHKDLIDIWPHPKCTHPFLIYCVKCYQFYEIRIEYYDQLIVIDGHIENGFL